MIIDIHTHLASGTEAHESVELEEVCRRHGIDLAFVSCLGNWEPFPSCAVVRAANDHACAAAAAHPERLRWLAYLNPQNADWRDELDRCAARGALGIKLWIALKDAAGRTDRTAGVLAEAGRRALPVLIHVFNRTDPNRPGELNVVEFAALARCAPRCTLIGAHAGGNWREAARVLRDGPPNAVVDISGSYPERGMVETLVASLGAKRVLYGSDALGRSMPSQLAKVLLADVDEETRHQVLWRNAAAVFGLIGLRPSTEPGAEAPARPGLDECEEHFCFCGRAPYWDTDGGTPMQLEALLATHGMATAYVGDLGAVFTDDPRQAANAGFARACVGLTRVRPLATLDPRAPDWQRSIEAAAEAPFAGGLVHPYLQGWRLDEPRWGDFFDACATRGLQLWINCALGDHRFRPPALPARTVTTEEVTAFAATAPDNRYVFQGAAPDTVRAVLSSSPPGEARFRFDISRLTDLGAQFADILTQYGPETLVLGSEFPFRDIKAVRFAARRPCV